ncbi:MAG: YybS family protein [Candidatus Cloacimonetes bacterium]|nr:YybS family protein [Candidatus Cloacimonadota bacterium]
MIIIALATLVISILSTFLGYIFIVSIGCVYLLDKEPRQRITFYSIICISLIVLYLSRIIPILEVSDIFGSVLLVSWIFIHVIKKTEDHSIALYYGCLSQIAYGVFRYVLFSGIYQKRVDMIFQGYETFLSSDTIIGNTNGQLESILEQIRIIMIDYHLAIWSASMIFAVYLATLFFSKRVAFKWQHHLFKLPQSLIYLLIVALVLALIQFTRVFGLNIVVIISIIMLLQGLAIVDFCCKKHLKNSRLILIAVIVLIFVNVYFALIVSLLGLIDNWLDIRKINHI